MLDRQAFQTHQGTQLICGQELLDSVWPWATGIPDALPNLSGVPHGRIGMTEVNQIETTTHMFRNWDNLYGGGLSREAVIGQLKWAASLLDGPYTEPVGRALFRAVADLASVAGWMSFDVGLHAAAQDYFVLGLHAAKEAGDRNLGAHLLNCMARQSSHLQRPGDALELIHLAQYGARHTGTATTAAVLYSLQARFCAMLGDTRECHRAAGRAEDVFDDAKPADDPVWVAYFDRSEYAATLGVVHLILAQQADDPTSAGRAISLLTQAIHARGSQRVRSRAFDHIALARAYLAEGELDGANQAAAIALQVLPDLNSARVQDRLRELYDDSTVISTNQPSPKYVTDSRPACT